jgi:integrase
MEKTNGDDEITQTVQEFLDDLKSDNTRQVYDLSLKMFAESIGKQRDDLSEYVLTTTRKQFYADLKTYATTLNKSKLLQNSVSARLLGIRSYASLHGLTIPKQHWNKLNKKEKEDYEGRPFSVKDARAVYKILSPKMQPIFITAYVTGARINELLTTELKNVNLDKVPGEIFIPARNTKTNTKRTCYLTAEAVTVLREWIKYLPKYRRLATAKSAGVKASQEKDGIDIKERDAGLLFPMSSTNFRQALNDACEKLGLNHGETRREYKVHSLRKSFSQIVGTDAQMRDLAETIMGHSDKTRAAYNTIPAEKLPGLYLKVQPFLMLTDEGQEAIKIHDEEQEALKNQLAVMQEQMKKMQKFIEMSIAAKE